jgi:hypothetical protein
MMNNFLRLSNLKHLLTFLGPKHGGDIDISEGQLTDFGNIEKKFQLIRLLFFLNNYHC